MILTDQTDVDPFMSARQLAWVITQLPIQGGTVTVTLPDHLPPVPYGLHGPLMGDDPVRKEEALHGPTLGGPHTQAQHTRLCKRPLRSTREVTVVFTRKYVMHVFAGQHLPPEGWDQDTFWREHAWSVDTPKRRPCLPRPTL